MVLFAAAFLAIFGAMYVGASRSHARGELDIAGVRILRWAMAGHLTIFIILALTAFVT